MYLNETYHRVQEGNICLTHFLLKNGLKQGDALSPLFFNFTLEYTIRGIQANQVGFKLNCTHQYLVYSDVKNGHATVTLAKGN
jgi:hypothetical protein